MAFNKRMRVMIRLKVLSLLGKNHSKAGVLRKSGLFKKYGQGGYWHPDWIPSYPELIEIGNNVTIAADVRIYEHDMIHWMWNQDVHYRGKKIEQKRAGVKIGDNSVLGARCIVLYNVKIGKNVVVGSGSIVTRDVPDYAIVAGCPAKIIGNTKELFKRRIAENGFDMTDYSYEKYFD